MLNYQRVPQVAPIAEAPVCSGHFSIYSEASGHSRLTQLSRKSFSKRILSSKELKWETTMPAESFIMVYLIYIDLWGVWFMGYYIMIMGW